MVCGGQCVIVTGTYTMQKWFVDKLDVGGLWQSCALQDLDWAVDTSGWIMSNVQELKHIYLSARTMGWESITAVNTVMLELFVQVWF